MTGPRIIQRRAIFLATEQPKRGDYVYPPIISETDEEFYVSQDYTEEEYLRDFPAGALVVIEPTDTFMHFLKPTTLEYGRIWRLVRPDEEA